jgi:hypothetical protein
MAYKIEIPDKNNEEAASFVGSLPLQTPVKPVTVVTKPVKSRVFSAATGDRVVTLPVTSGDQHQPVDATEGRVIAYLIASEILGADIWLALDDSFTVNDGLAVFYPDELPFLATKDAETLKEIHKVKLAFPGSRVRQ